VPYSSMVSSTTDCARRSSTTIVVSRTLLRPTALARPAVIVDIPIKWIPLRFSIPNPVHSSMRILGSPMPHSWRMEDARTAGAPTPPAQMFRDRSDSLQHDPQVHGNAVDGRRIKSLSRSWRRRSTLLLLSRCFLPSGGKKDLSAVKEVASCSAGSGHDVVHPLCLWMDVAVSERSKGVIASEYALGNCDSTTRF
jgi:hypothetical protein